MKKNLSAYSPQVALEASAQNNVVLGEFHIDHQQFLIISAEEYPNSALSSDHADLLHHGIQLIQFRVGGQQCAIVKIDHPSDANGLALADLLTERELQIAALVASGRPNKQIASQLHISEWTVSTHLRRIFMKLGVDSRAAMVYRCASLIQQLKGQLATIQQS